MNDVKYALKNGEWGYRKVTRKVMLLRRRSVCSWRLKVCMLTTSSVQALTSKVVSQDEIFRRVQHLLVPEEVILTAFGVNVNWWVLNTFPHLKLGMDVKSNGPFSAPATHSSSEINLTCPPPAKKHPNTTKQKPHKIPCWIFFAERQLAKMFSKSVRCFESALFSHL